MRDKVWKKLKRWKENVLSKARCETLIKVAIESILTYAKSYFKLPFSSCWYFDMMIAMFFWGGKSDSRKLHWLRWEAMFKSKWKTGLRFRRMKEFNESFLAKQLWILMQI